MKTSRLDKEYRSILENTGIELGPWATAEQYKKFPYGCARFEFNKTKASMDFIEALSCLDVLKDVNDKKDIWPIIQNFSKHSSLVDPWRIK